MTLPSTGDTIVAVATAPGQAGIGVVRLSGCNLGPMAVALCGRLPAPRTAVLARFRDADGAPIDEGLLLHFPAPASFTGEDVIELQGHGSPMALQMLVARCIELGARHAQPGEFIRRAFLNDKLDLLQAEAVADLIAAGSAAAVRSAGRSLAGAFSAEVGQLQDALTELRALIEATLDFPEEEVDPVYGEMVCHRLDDLCTALDGLLARARNGARLRRGLRVVLAGAPNVGKSSLLNALAGFDRAIVTDVAGTTRDTLDQTIELDGLMLNLIDTAGLRDSSDPVEQIGIAHSWREIGEADVVLDVRDIRDPNTAAYSEAMRIALAGGAEHLVVLNKCDLAGGIGCEDDGRLCLSARTGDGLDALRIRLRTLAGLESAAEDVVLARERHLAALGRTRDALELARQEADALELQAEALRHAQLALAELTGEVTADDVLGEIFGRFCIGK